MNSKFKFLWIICIILACVCWCLIPLIGINPPIDVLDVSLIAGLYFLGSCFFVYGIFLIIKFLTKKKALLIAECGHPVFNLEDRVSAFGKTILTEIPLVDGKTSYCHKCLGEMAIKCAWCGKPIFIGDRVTLYSPIEENYKVPPHAVIYSDNPLRLIGCLRKSCVRDDLFLDAGTWITPGKIQQKVFFELLN